MCILLLHAQASEKSDKGMEGGVHLWWEGGILLFYSYLLSFTEYVPFIFKLP